MVLEALTISMLPPWPSWMDSEATSTPITASAPTCCAYTTPSPLPPSLLPPTNSLKPAIRSLKTLASKTASPATNPTYLLTYLSSMSVVVVTISRPPERLLASRHASREQRQSHSSLVHYFEGDKNPPFGDTHLSGGVSPRPPRPASQVIDRSSPPSFLRRGVAPERVDHDVVGAVCVLLSPMLVMQCFHAGSYLTLHQARPTFYWVH
jgi:hypothetical protein